MCYHLLLVSTVIAHVSASSCTSFDLESENGNNLNQMPRSEASGKLTVLLKEGQVLENYFDVSSPSLNCLLSINNVAYSNDGASDLVELSLNGNELGQFRTVPQTGNGNYWNVILTTGAFGNYTRLLVGRNTLTLTVLQADTFGVEIDKVTLAVECTQNSNCPEIEFTASTSQSLPSEHGNSLSDGAIIGIVFGTIATVPGIPGCLVATCYLHNKCED